MPYNNFGLTTADVVALYPGTVASDFGGSAPIQSALDSATELVAAALTPQTFEALTWPQLEMVEARATAGQGTVQLGITPVIPKYVHIWKGQPVLFTTKPRMITDPFYTMGVGLSASTAYAGYYGTCTELDSSQFTATAAGLVTLMVPLVANDLVFATYKIDVTSPNYAEPSLAKIAVRIAGAELGARIYMSGDSQWGLVDMYAKQGAAYIEALRDGSMIPDQIRLLRWWDELERRAPKGATVRFQRG